MHTFDSIFKALQKMFFTSLNVIISGCILLFLVVICSLRHGSIIAYASLSFVSITFSIIFMALLVRYYLKIKPGAFSFKLCKYLFIESIPFGLANVFVLVLLQADTVMLSKMTSETVVGNYNVAYKIIFALMFFHTAYMISIYPVISKSFKDSKENLVISYEKTVKYFIMYGLFVAIFVTFRAHDIMYLLYGNKYKLGVTALQCLIWSYPFILLSTITAVTLNSINKTRVNTVFAALGAILNISLNLILIPKYSLIGAGAATIVTEIFIFVGAYSILSKHLIKINFLKISYKVIIASIALFLLLFAISSVNLFMAFFISLFMYLLVLIVFKYFTKGEYAIVKSFFIKDIGQTL